MEPDCLFRVLRDGKRIALASVAAEGMLVCAASSGERLVLAASGSGGWAGVGGSWEQRDGAICNSRWPEKASVTRDMQLCITLLRAWQRNC
jgi:hypothetical protein